MAVLKPINALIAVHSRFFGPNHSILSAITVAVTLLSQNLIKWRRLPATMRKISRGNRWRRLCRTSVLPAAHS